MKWWQIFDGKEGMSSGEILLFSACEDTLEINTFQIEIGVLYLVGPNHIGWEGEEGFETPRGTGNKPRIQMKRGKKPRDICRDHTPASRVAAEPDPAG